MSKDHARLTISTAGAFLIASCIITHSEGPDDVTTPLVLNMDRATLANRITQVKNAMPATDTNVWANLLEPLALQTDAYVKSRFEVCMQNTISEGHGLYIFLAEKGLESILKKLDAMPEGSTLTVNTDCAFLPWEILYSRPYDVTWPDEVKAANPPPDPTRLWGYRFMINYNLLDQDGTPDWVTLMAAHKSGQPYISLNLNPSITNTGRKFHPITYHRNFYDQHLAVKNIGNVYDSLSAILGQLYSNEQNATVIYLYCHGHNSVPFAADNSEMLEFAPGQPDKRLKPDALGKAPNVYARAPIVFLNSCLSAQTSPLSFSSFHAVFRKKQAMGIIGTSIEMPITFGAAFGCRLLEEYLKGVPLGVAIYALRRELVDNGNPLGLFYSLQCPIEVTAPEA